MARKRQRKKKQQQSEPLQVELLEDAADVDGELEDGSAVDGPADEPAADEDHVSGDRWARAAGTLKPSRGRGGALMRKGPEAGESTTAETDHLVRFCLRGIGGDRQEATAR